MSIIKTSNIVLSNIVATKKRSGNYTITYNKTPCYIQGLKSTVRMSTDEGISIV